MSHGQIVLIYASAMLAWQFIEMNLMIERIRADRKHFIAVRIIRLREWAKGKNKYWGGFVKAVAGMGLALLAWIPIIISAAIWPISVPVYILTNIEWSKLFGRK